MNLSLGKHWDDYLGELVTSGYYASASEAVRDALRLLLAEETKLTSLREKLHNAVALGGEHDDDAVGAAVEVRLAKWNQERKPV